MRLADGAISDIIVEAEREAAARIPKRIERIRTPEEGDQVVALLVGAVDDVLDRLVFLDLLDLERRVAETIGRGRGIEDLAYDRHLPAGEFLHLLLDAFEVVLGEGLVDLDVVVEPVLDGRTDGDLCLRPQLLYRFGQDVCRIVAQQFDAIVIAPADSKAMVEPIKKALDAGIHVINIDVALDPDAMADAGIDLAFFGPDNRAGAKLAGDANGDGVVNILDKVVVRNQFGQTGCGCE